MIGRWPPPDDLDQGKIAVAVSTAWDPSHRSARPERAATGGLAGCRTGISGTVIGHVLEAHGWPVAP
jgi:hypothetical protein